MSMGEDMTERSGWITFAGVAALIAGGYNALSGIAALADDDTLVAQAQEVLYGIDLTAWGWFWLLVGIVQLITGVLILQRNTWGALAWRSYRGPQRHVDRPGHVRLSAVGDRGPRGRLPCALWGADPKRRVRSVTLGQPPRVEAAHPAPRDRRDSALRWRDRPPRPARRQRRLDRVILGQRIVDLVISGCPQCSVTGRRRHESDRIEAGSAALRASGHPSRMTVPAGRALPSPQWSS